MSPRPRSLSFRGIVTECLRSIDFPRPCGTRRRHELPRCILSLSLDLFLLSLGCRACADIYPRHVCGCATHSWMSTLSINFPPSSRRDVPFYQRRRLSRTLNRRINRRTHLSALAPDRSRQFRIGNRERWLTFNVFPQSAEEAFFLRNLFVRVQTVA